MSARLLDRIMPLYDVKDAHTLRIDAPPARVYAAIKQFTPREAPIFGLLMGLRTVPARVLGRRRFSMQNDQPVLELFLRAGFTLLAEEPDRELVAGAISRPWLPRFATPYPVRDVRDFQACTAPGLAKMLMNFHLRPDRYGTVLSTETRVLATDPDARRKFARYWRFIHPGSALIRWAWLRAIRRRAERRVPSTAC